MADSPLWTRDEIVAATHGAAQGADFAATGVTFDTRELQPGDLFVALTGERDGHDFVAAAFAKGAAGALVSRPVESGPYVLVPYTLKALELLGAAARDRADARRIAVTGSVGKTSVTQALLASLRLAGPAHGSVKSFNNHIGVPLTLSRMPRETRYAVFEIGMNHAGEIGPLSRLVQPHVAVVTNVGPVHTENFADGEAGVAKAKAEIFQGLESGGTAVLNAEGAWFRKLAKAADNAGANVLACGYNEACEAQLLTVSTDSHGLSIAANVLGEERHFRLSQPGLHWAWNSLIVVLTGHAVGVPFDTVIQGLGSLAPLAGRGAEIRVALGQGAFTLIDESYNANPMSMRAAFDTLGRRPERKVAVLTDMLELGPRARELHAELAPVIVAAGVDRVFAAGSIMTSLFKALPPGLQGGWAESAAELAPQVTAAVRDGDVVMVKGSNGSKASLVVQALRALEVG